MNRYISEFATSTSADNWFGPRIYLCRKNTLRRALFSWVFRTANQRLSLYYLKQKSFVFRGWENIGSKVKNHQRIWKRWLNRLSSFRQQELGSACPFIFLIATFNLVKKVALSRTFPAVWSWWWWYYEFLDIQSLIFERGAVNMTNPLSSHCLQLIICTLTLLLSQI